jgi:hypothetical protein
MDLPPYAPERIQSLFRHVGGSWGTYETVMVVCMHTDERGEVCLQALLWLDELKSDR